MNTVRSATWSQGILDSTGVSEDILPYTVYERIKQLFEDAGITENEFGGNKALWMTWDAVHLWILESLMTVLLGRDVNDF
jgi:hypothetical protein